MSACVALREDYDRLELRRLAKTSRDPRQVRRLLGLAAAYDGLSRADAAKAGGMDRQTLRDWAHRFNEEGPDGLKNRAALDSQTKCNTGIVRSCDGQALQSARS